MDKEAIQQLAEQTWEKVDRELYGGVNPYAFILGFKYGFAAAASPQLSWVKAVESLDWLPLEKFLHVRDNVGCKRLGNFFKEDGEIKFSVCGTEMYQSFIIPQKDLWSIEWLEEAPSPTPLADWSALAKIAPPEKWIEMYQHYQELLIAADTAAFWKEQYDIANAERNVLKQQEAASQTIPNSNH
jgi:hypothetical protein